VTEGEWRTADDPRPMLRYVKGRVSDRKLRLFACGGLRRVWASLSVQPVREAVEAAERFADGTVSAADLQRACERAARAYQQAIGRDVYKIATDPDYAVTAHKLALAVSIASPVAPLQVLMDAPSPEEEFRAMFAPALLRCVVGNPFRTVAFDPRWRTADTVGLARAIYAARAFDRLPLLADALMDAGCADAQVLAHCRSAGPHALGCWVIDLVLGKE
jgi:hypothetical protein